MAALRQLEAVVVGLDIRRHIRAVVGNGLGVLVVPGVRDPLEEQQREDVRLEVRGIDRTPEAVGGRPQAGLQRLLGETQGLLRHPSSSAFWVEDLDGTSLSGRPGQ